MQFSETNSLLGRSRRTRSERTLGTPRGGSPDRPGPDLRTSRAGACSIPTLPASAVAVTALLGALALGACTPDPDEQAPQCPLAYLRPDATTLTRFDGRGTDLTNLVLSGRLQNIHGACKGLLGHKKLTAHAHVEMVLTRGPAARGRDFDVPYNIAIVSKGRVLQKQELSQHVTFPPNVDTVQVTGQEVNMDFPTDRGLTGPNYTIYFVFELTPAELAANQRALAEPR